MGQLVAAAIWKISNAIVIALDEHLGEPTDAYVNGSQVWMRDDGPNGEAIEWRLHPVAGYKKPPKIESTMLFSGIAFDIATGRPPVAAPAALWDGLEIFMAYDDEIEPITLATCGQHVLRIAPDLVGMVDHTTIGDRWEMSQGKVSIIDALVAQLS